MRIELENGDIQAFIDTAGAQLASMMMKEDKTEYIWQADPKVWASHGPVLFPIVGKLYNDEYLVDGTTYHLTQHGFARHMDFAVAASDGKSVICRLTSNEQTLALYPFGFQLDVSYTLQEDGVVVGYRVTNTGDRVMPFAIGGHPAFNCPLLNREKMEDYYLEFECPETALAYRLRDKYVLSEGQPVLNGRKVLPLSPDLFNEDALIFKELQSRKVAIRSSVSAKSVTVDFSGFPYLGIWSKPGPYVCIEPWCGIGDTAAGHQVFASREGMVSLAAGEAFEHSFRIRIS